MQPLSDHIRQAAALPLRGSKACVITSSNGKRWVIPKGLIEPGQTAGEGSKAFGAQWYALAPSGATIDRD